MKKHIKQEYQLYKETKKNIREVVLDRNIQVVDFYL